MVRRWGLYFARNGLGHPWARNSSWHSKMSRLWLNGGSYLVGELNQHVAAIDRNLGCLRTIDLIEHNAKDRCIFAEQRTANGTYSGAIYTQRGRLHPVGT